MARRPYFRNLLLKFMRNRSNRIIALRSRNFSPVVGLVVDGSADEHISVALALKQLLESNGTVVSGLCLLDRGNRQKNIPDGFITFSSLDITLLGKLRSASLKRFLAHRFNRLFCLGSKPTPALDFVLAHTRAKQRIGSYIPGSTKFLDLQVKVNEKTNNQQLAKTMLHYADYIKSE